MNDYIDEDRITCEYCGASYYPDVGSFHTCPEGQAAARLATEASDRRFRGTGEKISVRIVIELECFNSPEAVQSALECVELNSSAALNARDHVSGIDDVMECRYTMTRIIRNLP